MPTTSAKYGWPLSELSDPPDGPNQIADLGLAIEDTVAGDAITTWTPTWTSTGSPKPTNPATLSGRYSVSQGWCDFSLTMTIGSSTTGGVGSWAFVMPFKGHTSLAEQMSYGLLLEPQVAFFPLFGVIKANNNLLYVYVPQGPSMYFPPLRQSDGGVNSYNPSNAPGPIQTGGRVTVSGRYLIAA